MDKPKWQKARVVAEPSYPLMSGGELWVQGPPIRHSTRDIGSRKIHYNELVYQTNISYGTEGLMGFTPTDLELLPDFTNDPPMLTWEQFLAAAKGDC